MADTPESEQPDRPPPDPPKTERTTEPVPPPAPNKVRTKRSSGKGLAALMFFLGLLLGMLLGGIAGVFAPRTGVLEDLPLPTETADPAPSPEPTTITRTVEVEVETFRTPQSCLAALDDLTAHIEQLAEAREALMRADLARVSGDSEGADTGLADVDRQLRALIIAGNTRSVQTAVEDCREAGEQDRATPTPSPLESPGEPETEATPTPTPEIPGAASPEPLE